MAITHIMKQGMTDPLQLTLKDKNGRKPNLSGSTLVFYMQEPDGTQTINAGSVDVTDAAAAEVEYAWQAGETGDWGEFEAEIHETTSGGKLVVYPSDEYLVVVILEDRAP